MSPLVTAFTSTSSSLADSLALVTRWQHSAWLPRLARSNAVKRSPLSSGSVDRSIRASAASSSLTHSGRPCSHALINGVI